MHDCQSKKAQLVDLVYGEAADADGLRAEVMSCAACAEEYRALTAALHAFDRAAGEARPAEDFWPQYHARLARRLRAAEPEATPPVERPSPAGRTSARAASLRRALWAEWRVPAPVAIAAVLLIICLTPLALRPAPEAIPAAPAPRADAPAPVRTIEVPVVHEKIVTRTVYVVRPARAKSQARRAEGARLAAGAREGDGGARSSAPGRDTLTGFQPADDVKLRVIKGSFANEK